MRRAAPTSTSTTSCATTTCSRPSAAPTDSTATTRTTVTSWTSRSCSASVQEAIAVYSSDELDLEDGTDAENNVHLKSWLAEGTKKLDEAREALRYLCEPVALPREVEQFLHYFCGDAANPNALNETEALRVSFYKAVAAFVRAFAAIAQDLTEAGYSEAEAAAMQKEAAFYAEIRSAIKKHSGEELDIKPYEADMRHLLNTYVQADPAADLGGLGEMSLTELIIETGIHDAIARKLNEKGKLSKNAIAEGIINNVRKTIIRDQLTDPRFYEQMSLLLGDLIQQSRATLPSTRSFSGKLRRWRSGWLRSSLRRECPRRFTADERLLWSTTICRGFSPLDAKRLRKWRSPPRMSSWNSR
jgi:hypothetical protein